MVQILIYDILHQYADDSVVLSHEKKISTKTGFKSSQPVEFRKVPTGMSSKGLWNNPNQLSEEMVRCMKNIFMSLADSALPAKSSALESQCSTLSPRGHLSNSSWWSSSDCSMIQSPQIDMQNNSGVLASENVFDPYRVRGKLSWADIGNYGLAMEVSWMSVGKQQLEYASGALKTFRWDIISLLPFSFSPCLSLLSSSISVGGSCNIPKFYLINTVIFLFGEQNTSWATCQSEPCALEQQWEACFLDKPI